MKTPKNGRIANILHFLTVGVWSINLKKGTVRHSKLIHLLQIVILSGKEFIQKRYMEKASALTYYTILSIIPIAAMAFGVAKGFGFDKNMEEYLISFFADKQDIVDMILEFSESMLAKTQGGLIAGIGIVVLLWTVIKVMGNIESAFNEIWSVNKQRNYTRKLSDYLTIMFLAPICLIVSYGVTSYITGWITAMAQQIEWVSKFYSLLSFGLKLLPYSLLWFSFAILYLVMPNTKVQFKAAIISGIITGIAFQIIQHFYFKFQIGVSNYNAIYGSFAAIPLFLVWLQMSWTIILLGSGIAYSIQNVKNFEYELEVTQLSVQLKTKLALLVLHAIVQRFTNVQPPQTSLEISEDTEIPHRITKLVLSVLIDAELVYEVKTSNEETFAYAPAYDIEKMDIQSCVQKLQTVGINKLEFKTSESFNAIANIVENYSLPNNVVITNIP